LAKVKNNIQCTNNINIKTFNNLKTSAALIVHFEFPDLNNARSLDDIFPYDSEQ